VDGVADLAHVVSARSQNEEKRPPFATHCRQYPPTTAVLSTALRGQLHGRPAEVFAGRCFSFFLLWPPYGIGQAIIFLPCDFYLSFFLSISFPRLISAVGDRMSTIRDVALVRI